MAMGIIKPVLGLFIVFSISASAQTAPTTCVYSVYVKTGSFPFAGTDSTISAAFSTATGSKLSISNLVQWGGLMGNGYNYFKAGSVDVFSGFAPCLDEPICALFLNSTGANLFPSWYVESVQVSAAGWGKTCTQQLFNVNQWLSTIFSPFKLTANVNACNPKLSIAGDEPPVVYEV